VVTRHPALGGSLFWKGSGSDAPTTVLEFEHLRSQRRRRQTERNTSNQAMTPAIKMLIGDWHVDELGILTREITARD
jgi:hypothetical protein